MLVRLAWRAALGVDPATAAAVAFALGAVARSFP